MTKAQGILLVVIILAPLALRLPKLADRPMHTDEAVHAIKFADMLEKCSYRYDPNEYHGPTLNAFSLIPAWLCGQTDITKVTETTLRIIPVFFGMSLVILPLWLREVIGRPAALAAATLFAVSTAFAYYSRYYIQEILLVYFTLAVIVSIVRYVKKPTLFWAISAGMNLGFLHATKETCILNLGVMVLSFIAVVLLFRQHRKAVGESLKKINIVHVGVSLFVAALMSFLLYSWFFTNPGGFLDAFAAYKTYFHRAVNNDIHNHPWYYYLKMLVYSKSNSGLLWTEGFVVIAAIVGIYFAVKSKNLFWRFAAIYAVLMTITYSAIPYKTPWTMLSFYSLFIILAGYAIGERIQGTASKRCVLVIVVFVPIFFGMGVLSFFANFKYSSDPANPYVYAHTSRDIYTIVNRIDEIAQASTQDKDLYVQIIASDHDYWPLPWYLRSYSSVSYQADVIAELPPAPLMIISPDLQPRVLEYIYSSFEPGQKKLYVPAFEEPLFLRPGIELQGLITKELYDQLSASAAVQ